MKLKALQQGSTRIFNFFYWFSAEAPFNFLFVRCCLHYSVNATAASSRTNGLRPWSDPQTVKRTWHHTLCLSGSEYHDINQTVVWRGTNRVYFCIKNDTFEYYTLWEEHRVVDVAGSVCLCTDLGRCPAPLGQSSVREVKDFVLSQQLNPLRDGEQNALREFYVLLPPFYGVKQW